MRAGVGVGIVSGSSTGEVLGFLDGLENRPQKVSCKIWKFLPMYCKSFASSCVTLVLSHSSGVSIALPSPGI